MSVKGWNFKLLIVAWHGFEGGRRVRLPSSAPFETLGIATIPRVLLSLGNLRNATQRRFRTVQPLVAPRKLVAPHRRNHKMVARNVTSVTSWCLAIASNRNVVWR